MGLISGVEDGFGQETAFSDRERIGIENMD
jgi:hypothetical protein